MKQTKQNQTFIRRHKIIRFIPAVLWMAVIFYLSSRTGEEVGSLLPVFQKVFPFMESFNWGHFVSYFILAMTIDYGIGARADRLGIKVLIVMFCGVYGVSDEYHQSFVGGRMLDPIDLRNDMIGAALWTALVAIPPIKRLWRTIAS